MSVLAYLPMQNDHLTNDSFRYLFVLSCIGYRYLDVIYEVHGQLAIFFYSRHSTRLHPILISLEFKSNST